MAVSLLGGRYRLDDFISRTPMAEVRLAHDTDLDRAVVVKLLARDADPARFEREARAVAALAHPNIVQLFDFGETTESSYMVFEYLPGGSLEQRLSETAASPDGDVLRIATDVAAGLAHAHQHGVVHRDLKPANILFDVHGRAKVADFGIANVEGAQTLTAAGTILGTAAYISPEQVCGEPATPASDVYAFGVVLYRMLEGRLPFEADSVPQLARMHRDLAPPPLDDVSDANRQLAALAMSALAKEPTARPADGAALLRALQTGPEPVTSAAAATTQVIPRPRGRRPGENRTRLLAGVAALLLAAGGALAAVALTSRNTSAPAGPLPSSAPTTRPATTAPIATPSSSATRSGTTSTTTRATSMTSPRTSTVSPTSTAAETTASTPTLQESTPPATTTSADTTAPATTAAP